MRSLALLLGAAVAVKAQVFQLPNNVPPLDNLPPMPTLTKRGKSSEPCADVAELWAAQKAQNATSIRVPADIAYNCLQTVPVDVDGDQKEILELKDYLDWHSTLAWLKSGVDGQIKPTDLISSLDDIASNVKSGKYKSDYEVQFAIRALLDSAGDYHVYYIPDITGIFQFARMTGSLVSLSEDGVKLPKIYLANEMAAGKIASPIVTINGKNASAYLEQYSSGHNYHDVDTRYNTIFPNLAQQAVGQVSEGLFQTHYVYDGASTVLTFANGTTKSFDNVAFIGATRDFSNVSDGPSFFEEFCTGPTPTPENEEEADVEEEETEDQEDEDEDVEEEEEEVESLVKRATASSSVTSAATSLKPSTTAPVSSLKPLSVTMSSMRTNTTAPASTATSKPALTNLPGYPKPVFINEDGKMSGYYLNESDANDVAVLVVPAFDPVVVGAKPYPAHGGFLQTQQQRRAFFADAVKQGKKKLVIDLRGNGGGLIANGFELFKELFPTIEPYGAARFRASEAFHYYTAIVADLAVNGSDFDGIDNWKINPKDGDYGVSSTYLWSNIVDNDHKPYNSYADWWGPETIHNDSFTGIRRYNFSDNTGGHPIDVDLTGYGSLATPAPSQPFPAENILIIQDGLCGSTCAIFSELMREQGKVQTVVMGGRPQNGPMQSIGGTKGSQVFEFDTIMVYVHRVLLAAKALDGDFVAQKLNDTTPLGRIISGTQLAKRTMDVGKNILGGINALNNQRQGDSTQTPLEYIYDAADCRLFYTKDTYYNPVSLWRQAVNAKWATGTCVQGSTGDKAAISTANNQPFGSGKQTSDTNNSNQSSDSNKKNAAASGRKAPALVLLLAAIVAVASIL